MQRIDVTGEGITVTLVTEPLVSVFGKEMHPGSTFASVLPWEEISDVSLSAINLDADSTSWLALTVNATYGEYFEVHENAEGFAAAVDDLCQMSGFPIPDVAALSAVGTVIWAGPAPFRPMRNASP